MRPRVLAETRTPTASPSSIESAPGSCAAAMNLASRNSGAPLASSARIPRTLPAPQFFGPTMTKPDSRSSTACSRRRLAPPLTVSGRPLTNGEEGEQTRRRNLGLRMASFTRLRLTLSLSARGGKS